MKKEKRISGWKIIRFQGKAVSFNKLYEMRHWKTRATLANKYHEIFRILLARDFGPIPKKKANFSILVAFNNRYDTDNLCAMEKFFTDTYVKAGYAEDDSTKFFKGLNIIYDETLPKNTVDFYVILHK